MNKLKTVLESLGYEFSINGNKIIFKDEVYINKVKSELNDKEINYSWSYERGKAVFYINKDTLNKL